MNILSIGVITAYVVILFYYINDTDYTKMLGLTLVTALIICQLKNTNLVEGASCSVKQPQNLLPIVMPILILELVLMMLTMVMVKCQKLN